MKIRKNTLVELFINLLLILMLVLIVFGTPNKYSSMVIIGGFIIIVSIAVMKKYWNNSEMSLFIGIISLINISLVTSVCFSTYSTAFNWQIRLIDYPENIINLKNYLIYIVALFIGMGRIKESKNDDDEEIYFYKNNFIIFWGLFLVLLYILIFCFDRGVIGEYSSNSNILYEYAPILFIYSWKYAQNKRFKGILVIYALIYSLQGLIFGDRSSSFPMILALFLLNYRKTVKMYQVILIGILGILLSNFIDYFRNNGFTSVKLLIDGMRSRRLFVNTISYSFYGGTQIIRFSSVDENKLLHFINYIKAIIFGGSRKSTLTVIASNAGFYNKGGGFTSSYFYYWGGYIATFIGAIIMGKLIKLIFNHQGKLYDILKLSITIFSIRWIVYYPVAFFRTAVFVPIICYMVISVGDRILKKNDN